MPESTPGLPGEELAKQLGISVRALRTWTKAGRGPRPAPHGRRTRHDDFAVLRARAALVLRERGMSIPLAKAELDRRSEAELRALLGEEVAPAVVASSPPAVVTSVVASEPPSGLPQPPPSAADVTESVALAPSAPSVASVPSVVPAPSVIPSLPTSATPSVEREPPSAPAPPELGPSWHHLELLPGLVLLVRHDASPFVVGLARSIAAGALPRP